MSFNRKHTNSAMVGTRKKANLKKELHFHTNEHSNMLNGWLKEKKYAKPDALKKVKVLDVMNHIAAVKVTATWGIDYILVSRQGDKWMAEQILWSGVSAKEKAINASAHL